MSLNKKIDELWASKSEIKNDKELFDEAKLYSNQVIELLNSGKERVAQKAQEGWVINQWVKKAILLYFMTSEMKIMDGGCMQWYDKINLKLTQETNFAKMGVRAVPGCYVRTGSFIGENVVLMPSFVNIGAYIGQGTMVDSWATIGSCAQIGRNCHISGGAGIGGVLEPLQANPVIIEDNCFIGARSEIAEGVIVEEGAVIGMGVFIGSSTKIVDRHTGEITYGRVPAYSVVVPGVLPAKSNNLPGLACAVIIKKVDEKTRAKVSINDLLRESGVFPI